MTVFSLMNWRNKDLASEEILYEVKENQSPLLLHPFAKRMISFLDPKLFTRAALLPIPSSTGRKHSQLLAESLSLLAGAAILDGLILFEKDRQPGKGRQERRQRKIGASPALLRELHSYTTVLLIDDVVTSGGTMEAARKALGIDPKVYGLTLFSRVLSTEFASI